MCGRGWSRAALRLLFSPRYYVACLRTPHSNWQSRPGFDTEVSRVFFFSVGGCLAVSGLDSRPVADAMYLNTAKTTVRSSLRAAPAGQTITETKKKKSKTGNGSTLSVHCNEVYPIGPRSDRSLGEGTWQRSRSDSDSVCTDLENSRSFSRATRRWSGYYVLR
jgi:hypothetical protein